MSIYTESNGVNKILYFVVILLLHLSHEAQGQKLELRDININYRIFEIAAAGNNPTTIGPLMKDPAAYERYIKTIPCWNRRGKIPTQVRRQRGTWSGYIFGIPQEIIVFLNPIIHFFLTFAATNTRIVKND